MVKYVYFSIFEKVCFLICKIAAISYLIIRFIMPNMLFNAFTIFKITTFK